MEKSKGPCIIQLNNTSCKNTTRSLLLLFPSLFWPWSSSPIDLSSLSCSSSKFAPFWVLSSCNLDLIFVTNKSDFPLVILPKWKLQSSNWLLRINARFVHWDQFFVTSAPRIDTDLWLNVVLTWCVIVCLFLHLVFELNIKYRFLTPEAICSDMCQGFCWQAWSFVLDRWDCSLEVWI